MKKIRKKWWLFLAVLMMALSISPTATVFAGGSSVGGSGSGKGVPIYPGRTPWKLPPITKQIMLPAGTTSYKGKVDFDVKVTLTDVKVITGEQKGYFSGGEGQNVVDGDPVSQEYPNAFLISFTGNEISGNGSVSKSLDIDRFIHEKVFELERQLMLSIGPVKENTRIKYGKIKVEISESENVAPDLKPVYPGKKPITMEIVSTGRGYGPVIPAPPQQPQGGTYAPDVNINGPKVDVDVPDVDVQGPPTIGIQPPSAPRVLYNEQTFINRYTPDKPKDKPECPNVCPNPDQGNCRQNTCDTPCKSGCPDINININNENNSSANNNNVNTNTNVGRDQYNVNQNANPNPNLKLDRYNHFVYVHGYPDRSFRPEGTITRGEMTAIFRRLLDQGTFMGGNSTAFRDVRSGDWYASDVDRLSTLGVISGYPDGSFRPNASVTRGEFASVAAKFVSAKSGQGFSDLNGHWAQNAIEKLNAAGWVSGYGDGSFRPDAVITRAEVVSIVNRMLERTADAGYVQNHRGSLIQYTDLSSSHWAYLPIMEASNAHDYTRNSDGSETWTRNWK